VALSAGFQRWLFALALSKWPQRMASVHVSQRWLSLRGSHDDGTATTRRQTTMTTTTTKTTRIMARVLTTMKMMTMMTMETTMMTKTMMKTMKTTTTTTMTTKTKRQEEAWQQDKQYPVTL
jgi:hypothetical protein